MAKRYVKKKRMKGKMRRNRLALLAILAAALIALIVCLVSCHRDRAPAAGGDALWDGGWYGDDLGRIEKEKPLIQGMKAFEKATGLRPYLYLTNGIEPEALEEFAEEQYEALFSDAGHLLVVYDEWGEGAYYLAAQTGTDSSLSEEKVAELLSRLERAYADPTYGTYAAAFGAGFAQEAEALSPARQADGVGLLLILAGTLIALSLILVLLLRKRARYAAD